MKKRMLITFLAVVGIVAVYLLTTKTQGRNTPPGMVLIPAGEFVMGSNDAVSGENEAPVRSVSVDAFYLDAHEVTNAEYKAFLLENPRWQKGRIDAQFHNGNYLKQWRGNNYPSEKGNHPVTYVSWYAAMAYAEWAGKRLSTEAEWEKAARGGLAGKKYPWGDTMTQQNANYGADIVGTTAVGRYPANGYGLYDIVGNVSEWCLDEYDADFYLVSPKENPLSGANSIAWVSQNFTNVKNVRVLRGGSWAYNPEFIQVAHRVASTPPYTCATIGFRCAQTVTP